MCFTFSGKVRIKQGLRDDGVCYIWDAPAYSFNEALKWGCSKGAAKSRLELQYVQVLEMITSSSLSSRSVTYESECLNFFDGLAGQYLAVAKWPRGMIHPYTCKGTCLLEGIIQSRRVQLRKNRVCYEFSDVAVIVRRKLLANLLRPLTSFPSHLFYVCNTIFFPTFLFALSFWKNKQTDTCVL